jgi:hypothetical protein
MLAARRGLVNRDDEIHERHERQESRCGHALSPARPDADPVAVAARMSHTHSAAVSGCSPSCARRSGQDEGVAVMTAVLGDITKQTVDAIVNAADEATR